jgi:hypothetical protein
VTTARRRSIVERHSRVTARHRHRHLAWYAGLGVMAVIEIIEWPVAIMMMLGHAIVHRAHSEALRDFAQGVAAGV